MAGSLGALLLYPALFWGQFYGWKLLQGRQLKSVARELLGEAPLESALLGVLGFAACLIGILAGLRWLRPRQVALLRKAALYRKPLMTGLVITVVGFYLLRYISLAPFLPYHPSGLVNPDTFGLEFQAKVFADGNLWAEAPGPCFDTESIVQHEGRWFGKYPPATPLYFAIGEALFSDPRPLAMLLPLLAALFVGLLATEIFGTSAGYLAAALWLVSVEGLIHGPTIRSNPLAAVLVALAAWAAVRLVKSGRSGWAGLLLFCVFLQVNNRIFDALIMSAGLGAYALFFFKSNRKASLTIGLATVIGLFLGFAGMLGVNQLYTGDPVRAPFVVYSPFDIPGFGLRQHSPDLTMAEFTLADVPASALAPFKALHRTYTPLGLLLLVVALPALWGKARRETALILVTLGSLVSYGLFWYPSVRYGIVVMPLVSVLLAGGCLYFGARRWQKALVAGFLFLQFVIYPAYNTAFCNLAPVATASELALIAEAKSQPTLVFLSPATIQFGEFEGTKPRTVARRIGRPNQGLGALIPDPALEGPLVVAVDRGEDENAKVIARLPGRRVLRATYDAKGEVVIEPYTRQKGPK